jgi:hypothetical protein
MTLSGSFQGSTATFRDGRVTIQQSTSFGITASSPLLSIGDISLRGINKSYSYYSSTTSITNQVICRAPIFVFGAATYKITIKNSEWSNDVIGGQNISIFVVTLQNGILNWTENVLFNGANMPSYNLSYSFPTLSILATQSVIIGKFVVPFIEYTIEIETII